MAAARALLAALAVGGLLAGAGADESPKLTIHMIAHSHCDPGWLESFEGYYSSQVGTILSSVTNELTGHPDRRFIWAEVSFFMRWYETQGEEMKDKIRALIKNGQFEFVSGGWVQNDEANPTYEAVIAQLAEGNEYLLSLFGVKPRIAVQFDPFGHAAATAAISALAGYDALVINRIDYSVKDALKQRAAMEFVWKPYATSPALMDSAAAAAGASGGGGSSASAPSWAHQPPPPSYTNASIFTHVLHTHYSAPRSFDFENPEAIHVSSYNARQRAADLASECRTRARAYRSSHLLVPFGDDFKFQNAGTQFNNMDQIIAAAAAANAAGGDAGGRDGALHNVVIRYSTLSEYFQAVWEEAHANTIRDEDGTGSSTSSIGGGEGAAGGQHGGEASASTSEAEGRAVATIHFPSLHPEHDLDGGIDFFPYADNGNSWWTGYYTSRPLLKQMIRRASNTLRGADALLSLVRPWAGAWQEAATALLKAAQTDAAAAGNATASANGVLSALDVSLLASFARASSAHPYSSYSWMAAWQRLEQGRLDAALCLHHDAITGTSRASVVEDYTNRMVDAVVGATGVLSDAASLVLGGLPRAMKVALGLPSPSSAAGDAAATVKSGSGAHAHHHHGDVPADAALVELGPAPLTHVPHVLPVAEHVPVSVVTHTKGAAAGASGAAPAPAAVTVGSDTAAQPVVVYNPTAWRRRVVVTVMLDLGSAWSDAGAGAAGASCRRHAWPHAIVSDDNGVPVPSQWTSTVEGGDVASHAHAWLQRQQQAAARKSPAIVYGSAFLAAAAVDAEGAGSGSAAADKFAATGMRYELAFEADVPAYGLATYFVTAGWSATVTIIDTATKKATATHKLLCGDGSAAVAQLPLQLQAVFSVMPTIAVLTPGASAGTPAPSGGDAASAAGRLLLVDVDAPAKSAAGAGSTAAPIVLENACLRVEIDSHSGLLAAITYKQARRDVAAAVAGAEVDAATGEVRVPVVQRFGVYKTHQSGAYIFRPVAAPVTHDASVSAGGKPRDGITVAVTTSMGAVGAGGQSTGSGRGLIQIARVVTPHFAQTIRLVDTLGWYERSSADHATTGGDSHDDDTLYAAACSDPLVSDGTLDLRPTVSAGGNEEFVMQLDTGIDVVRTAAEAAAGSGNVSPAENDDARFSPNIRDNIGGASFLGSAPAPAADAGAGSSGLPVSPYSKEAFVAAGGAGVCSPPTAAASAGFTHAAPHGWWTGDSMGLLRRRLAHQRAGDGEIQRFYYPLNTLARLSGAVPHSARTPSDDDDDHATAWMTLYTAQPLGTTARILADGRTRMEVMLHRHLSQDDGRGLATGVYDSTVLTPRLALTMQAELHTSCAMNAVGHSSGGAAAAAAHSARNDMGAASSGAGSAATSGSTSQRALHAGIGAAHPEWAWAWATRAALHHQQHVTLHADTGDLAAKVAAANDFVNGGKKPASGGSKGGQQSGVIPPLDASTHLASLRATLAEAALPRSAWTARFATRFEPVAKGLWWLPNADAGNKVAFDAYGPALQAVCGADAATAASSLTDQLGLRQICHHLRDESAGASPADLSSSSLSSWRRLHNNAGTAGDGLPPWLHVVHLQSRDAVTDDVVIRLQNFGGPATVVDVDGILGKRSLAKYGAHAERRTAFAPLVVQNWRPRTANLNRHEGYLTPTTTSAAEEAAELAAGGAHGGHRHRHVYASSLDAAAITPAAMVHSFPLALASVVQAMRSDAGLVRKHSAAHLTFTGALAVGERIGRDVGLSANDLGTAVSQNTQEEGVFVSDAALAKMKADAGGQQHGRLLLAMPEEADFNGGGVGGRRLLQAARKPKPATNTAAAAGGRRLETGKSKPKAAGNNKAAGSKAKAPPARRAAAPVAAAVEPVAVDGSHIDAVMLLPPTTIRTAIVGLDAHVATFTSAGKVGAAVSAAEAAQRVVALLKSINPWVAAVGMRAPGGAAAAAPGSQAASKAAPSASEARANLMSMVAALVLNKEEREAMTQRVEAGQALTDEQQKRLMKLSRMQLRVHEQPRPDDLEERLKRVTAGAGKGSGAGAATADNGGFKSQPQVPTGDPAGATGDPWADEEAAEAQVKSLLAAADAANAGAGGRFQAGGDADDDGVAEAVEQAEDEEQEEDGSGWFFGGDEEAGDDEGQGVSEDDEDGGADAVEGSGGATSAGVDGQQLSSPQQPQPGMSRMRALRKRILENERTVLLVSFVGVFAAVALFCMCGGARSFQRILAVAGLAQGSGKEHGGLLPTSTARTAAAAGDGEDEDDGTEAVGGAIAWVLGVFGQAPAKRGVLKRMLNTGGKVA